jgi:putative ABC transport system permease protein
MTLGNDIKHAARSLRRTPGITALAVVILALAIGANTALFSLLDAALLRPLPFWQPHDLAVVTQIRTETGEDAQVSARDYLDWKKQATSFSELAAWREWSHGGRGAPAGRCRFGGGDSASAASCKGGSDGGVEE